jgi:asparagine synthase (glutamine-hydrolysing)
MRLQTGMLNRDGRQVTTADLHHLVCPFGEGYNDISGEVFANHVLLAYRGNRITDEEICETQPVRLANAVITWDGRLDNREEIAACLGLPRSAGLSDPALVSRLYESLSERAWENLIGEYAFVVWSASTRTLSMVRSICGSRQLYYVLTRNQLLWSNDLAQLVYRSGADLAVDEAYMIEYLTGHPMSSRSPFKHIHVVPPGSLVQVSSSVAPATRVLWRPSDIEPDRTKDSSKYEEELREHIERAMRSKLRSSYPVFCELSGGLDTSTLVVAGDRVLTSNGKGTDKLITVSCLYERSRTCDEEYFIRLVDEKRAIRGLRVSEAEQAIAIDLDDNTFTGIPTTNTFFRGRYLSYARHMHRHKARVLLTGYGGDHLFWAEPDGASLVADELRTGHFGSAHRLCRIWSQTSRLPYFQLLFRKALPLALGSAPPTVFLTKPLPPRWLRAEHLPTWSAITWQARAEAARVKEPSRRVQIHYVLNMLDQTSAGHFGQYRDIYVSHPYAYRPLVEFCLSTPVSQFLLDGQTRSLMRRAMHDILPLKIAMRQSKGSLDETVARAIHKAWDQLQDVENWVLCERGYADSAELLTSLRKARNGLLVPGEYLTRVITLESWLRSLDALSTNGIRTEEARIGVHVEGRNDGPSSTRRR